MSNLTLFRNGSDGCVYADPANPDYTVRFKSTSSRKNLNGLVCQNVVEEIIVNDLHSVTKGSVTAADAVSVRFRVSGSNLSAQRKKAIATAFASQLAAWANEGCLEGFPPVTAPIVVA